MPPNPNGSPGNQRTFRVENRERIDGRFYNEKVDAAPAVTKYRPNNSYVNKRIVRDVDFGEKTEIINKLQLDELKQRIART